MIRHVEGCSQAAESVSGPGWASAQASSRRLLSARAAPRSQAIPPSHASPSRPCSAPGHYDITCRCSAPTCRKHLSCTIIPRAPKNIMPADNADSALMHIWQQTTYQLKLSMRGRPGEVWRSVRHRRSLPGRFAGAGLGSQGRIPLWDGGRQRDSPPSGLKGTQQHRSRKRPARAARPRVLPHLTMQSLLIAVRTLFAPATKSALPYFRTLQQEVYLEPPAWQDDASSIFSVGQSHLVSYPYREWY